MGTAATSLLFPANGKTIHSAIKNDEVTDTISQTERVMRTLMVRRFNCLRLRPFMPSTRLILSACSGFMFIDT